MTGGSEKEEVEEGGRLEQLTGQGHVILVNGLRAGKNSARKGVSVHSACVKFLRHEKGER